MDWQEEVIKMLKEDDTRSLARCLMERTRHITPPDKEDEECLGNILDDVSRELPQHRAMWIAFWLGAAWQKGRN